ncbi:MAG: IclR family transcriptional regulator [Modestobacter sp.]|jgi:IclR family acetate operon transcriptional repressor|nr:IclR family transcriptional regulator [Modestobacter sp.]
MVRRVDAEQPPGTPQGGRRVDKRAMLQSVERTFAVLDVIVHQPDPVSIADLAIQLGVDRTIIHRILRTLQAEEFVEIAPGGGYVIGPRALVFGNAYRDRQSLRSAALPYMADFARSVGDRQLMVSVAVVVRDELILVDQVWNPGMSLDLVFGGGSRFPVDQTASGRALLAYMSPEQVIEVVGVDRARELELHARAIRAAGGIEFHSRAGQEGHNAIAAVIFPRNGRPRSALLLSGIGLDGELHPDSPTAHQVRRYADRIGEQL